MFKALRIAVGFLTILPGSPKQVDSTDMGKAVALFPLVGVIYAIIAWGGLRLFSYIFSIEVASFLTVFLLIVLNGGIHVDGFMDCCDGLGGKTPERRLVIMKDSRIGAFGVIAGGFLLLGKFLLLKSIANQPLIVFIALFSISRWSMAFQIYTQPSVSQGLLKSFQIEKRLFGFLAASGLILPLGFWMFPYSLILIGLTLLTLFFFNLIVKRKFGGITGDVLGATNELIELIGLLFFSMKLS
ncbi:MAG: adenosylcobinamide-GDP ribazoletransferase [Firmicutes bacterium]|nr:adenosylcobinamide-GDP ribazoletransferase [Bacillota bacterium]